MYKATFLGMVINHIFYFIIEGGISGQMKNIHHNLSVVLLDDDGMSLLELEQIITTHHLAKINAVYSNPNIFLKDLSTLNFDILILDCDMPGISAREIIGKIGCERCIINTGSKDKYEEAIECHPIDILLKPTKDIQLSKAFEKALKFISRENGNAEYHLFNVAQNKLKVQIKLSDIVYVHSDETDSRNKDIILRDGKKYTLMNCSFKDLLHIAPSLIQVNHSEAISLEIVCSKGFDEIILSGIPGVIDQKSVTLSHTYRNDFINRYDCV